MRSIICSWTVHCMAHHVHGLYLFCLLNLILFILGQHKLKYFYHISSSLLYSKYFSFIARGKKKKKIKQLLPLLLLLKLKMAALIPIFLGIIAIVAIKAVFLGKIAFALNAITLIRKLFNKNHSSGGGTSYSAPHHHDEHPGYSYEPAQSGWSRQANDASSLAYASHITK